MQIIIEKIKLLKQKWIFFSFFGKKKINKEELPKKKNNNRLHEFICCTNEQRNNIFILYYQCKINEQLRSCDLKLIQSFRLKIFCIFDSLEP